MSVKRVLIVCVICVSLLPGCNRTPPPDPYGGATITGKVRFNGEPLPGGVVFFIVEDKGQTFRGNGTIQPDGTYQVGKARPGEAKIAVDTEMLKPPANPPAKVAPPPPGYVAAKYVPIPSKYADHNTSGLTLAIQPGAQTFDIELKP